MVSDFLLAIWDGMYLHRVRAWCYCLTIAALLGLAICTAIGLIPLAAWGDVLVWPLAWLSAGGFGLAMLKLSGLALLLLACAVLASVLGNEGVRQ